MNAKEDPCMFLYERKPKQMHAGRPKNATVLLLILHTLIPRQTNMTKILLFMVFLM